MTLTIHVESPLSDDGRAMIAGSQAALLAVFAPDEIFTMTAEELAQPGITFYVARTDGAAVGSVACCDCGDYAEVKRLYVAPAGRGAGIAQALMDRLESDARLAGKTCVMLETGDALVAATALYRKRGYRVRGPFGSYPEHPASLFMEKRL
jgi:putative acetyltransferase